MNYRRLFIWVEGPDDKRFFEKIIEPKLKENYNLVETREYSKLKKEKIKNFFKSIRAMGADYIFAADINNTPCVTLKKQVIQNKLRKINKESIIVVIKEIESWYLAGIDNVESKRLKIHSYDNTDTITKEQFNDLIPDKFDSRIDFMLEILKIFSIETAKQKNKSFCYFIKKYNC